jgi:hypothetical protein
MKPQFDFPFIAKHWHRRTGYFAFLTVLLLAEVALLVSNPVALFVVMVVSIVLVEAAWQLARSLPVTKRGKLGFVISMTSDDEKEAAKIRADFVITLRRLLKEGSSGSTFQVIEVPQHHAEHVLDVEDAQRLRLRTRAHFLLYGRVRVRNVHGRPHRFFELDGAVSHQPIPLEVSRALAREFSELLPRKVLTPVEDDLFAFQFTSEWAELVAKYIIGSAAALSRDFDHAERLYTEVLERVTKVRGDFPVFAKLRERLPKRISETYEARARLLYEQWVSTHDPSLIDRLGDYLARIDFNSYSSQPVLTLNAIFAFLKFKSVPRALEWLEKTSSSARDAVWHLNVAFLLAYERNLRGAIKHYRKALELPMPADVIGKVEDFVYYVASNEPAKYQLYYCLGFFNWKVKRDLLQARNDFKTFIGKRRSGEFDKEIKLATKWLAQLETKA